MPHGITDDDSVPPVSHARWPPRAAWRVGIDEPPQSISSARLCSQYIHCLVAGSSASVIATKAWARRMCLTSSLCLSLFEHLETAASSGWRRKMSQSAQACCGHGSFVAILRQTSTGREAHAPERDEEEEHTDPSGQASPQEEPQMFPK